MAFKSTGRTRTLQGSGVWHTSCAWDGHLVPFNNDPCPGVKGSVVSEFFGIVPVYGWNFGYMFHCDCNTELLPEYSAGGTLIDCRKRVSLNFRSPFGSKTEFMDALGVSNEYMNLAGTWSFSVDVEEVCELRVLESLVGSEANMPPVTADFRYRTLIGGVIACHLTMGSLVLDASFPITQSVLVNPLGAIRGCACKMFVNAVSTGGPSVLPATFGFTGSILGEPIEVPPVTVSSYVGQTAGGTVTAGSGLYGNLTFYNLRFPFVSASLNWRVPEIYQSILKTYDVDSEITAVQDISFYENRSGQGTQPIGTFSPSASFERRQYQLSISREPSSANLVVNTSLSSGVGATINTFLPPYSGFFYDKSVFFRLKPVLAGQLILPPRKVINACTSIARWTWQGLATLYSGFIEMRSGARCAVADITTGQLLNGESYRYIEVELRVQTANAVIDVSLRTNSSGSLYKRYTIQCGQAGLWNTYRIDTCLPNNPTSPTDLQDSRYPLVQGSETSPPLQEESYWGVNRMVQIGFEFSVSTVDIRRLDFIARELPSVGFMNSDKTSTYYSTSGSVSVSMRGFVDGKLGLEGPSRILPGVEWVQVPFLQQALSFQASHWSFAQNVNWVNSWQYLPYLSFFGGGGLIANGDIPALWIDKPLTPSGTLDVYSSVCVSTVMAMPGMGRVLDSGIFERTIRLPIFKIWRGKFYGIASSSPGQVAAGAVVGTFENPSGATGGTDSTDYQGVYSTGAPYGKPVQPPYRIPSIGSLIEVSNANRHYRRACFIPTLESNRDAIAIEFSMRSYLVARIQNGNLVLQFTDHHGVVPDTVIEVVPNVGDAKNIRLESLIDSAYWLSYILDGVVITRYSLDDGRTWLVINMGGGTSVKRHRWVFNPRALEGVLVILDATGKVYVQCYNEGRELAYNGVNNPIATGAPDSDIDGVYVDADTGWIDVAIQKVASIDIYRSHDEGRSFSLWASLT